MVRHAHTLPGEVRPGLPSSSPAGPKSLCTFPSGTHHVFISSSGLDLCKTCYSCTKAEMQLGSSRRNFTTAPLLMFLEKGTPVTLSLEHKVRRLTLPLLQLP